MNSLDLLSFGKKQERKNDREDSYKLPVQQQLSETQVVLQQQQQQQSNTKYIKKLSHDRVDTLKTQKSENKLSSQLDALKMKESKETEKKVPSLILNVQQGRKESSQNIGGNKAEVIIKSPNQAATQTKSEKIEALKQKLGISKQTTKVYVKQEKKKQGIIKILGTKISNWVMRKWKMCCKKKSRKKREASQKSNLKDQSKRRTGLFSKDKQDQNSSGGEDGVNSSTNYSKRDSVRQSIQKTQSSTISMHSNEQEKVDKEIQQLRDVVKIMSKEKMYQKAYRHLMDGLLYRSVRHDLDGEETTWKKFILLIWRVQNSSLWNDFLLFLGWVYIIMSFLEPSHRNDSSLDEQSFLAMALLESFILFLQTLDLFMEIIQRSSQEHQNILKAFIGRKKNLFRLLFFLLNTSDLINYVNSYPTNTFRFARVFRPLQIIIFSKSLRRNFQGIINSAKNLLMILFFDIIITSFWAYIGVNMIGDLYNDPEIDTFAVDFRDFFKAANVLYIFSSLDVYPDILFPAVTNSFYYFLYFLPYLVMFLLLFAPIPVAVVYEGFRKHRLNLLIADRIKRRKALWACFQCIVSDTKKSYIAKPDFCAFFSFVYKKVELDEAAEILSDVLWNELDANDNKKVSIEEFFTVIDFTEQRKEFRLQRIKPGRWWVNFREYIQNKYDLLGFLNSTKWEAASFLVTIGSCVITIIGLIDDTMTDNTIADIFDKSFFVFFILEIVLKMVALGPNSFFDESWNVFDLTLVLFQAFFDYIFFSFMKGSNVKSVSASRVLKIAKLQKVFRMFRAFRTVKVLNYILSGLDIIQRVYEMLYKIVICIPIVMKLSVICVIVLYIYAAIGVELFSTQLREIYPSKYGQQQCDQTDPNQTDFNKCQYASFDNFGGAVLILLQVCVGSGWGNILFDYGQKFKGLTTSAVYFNSFHFLSVFVLSLIGGLVWEVFDVVERIMRDQQAYEQQLELQRQWEEQQQQIEASFQSTDQIKKNNSQNQSQFAKRNSVRQSIKVATAFMKVPLAQKYNMKMPSNHEHYEDDEDDMIENMQNNRDMEMAYQLDEKSLSKNKSIQNKSENQMEKNDSDNQNQVSGDDGDEDDIGTSAEEEDDEEDEDDDAGDESDGYDDQEEDGDYFGDDEDAQQQDNVNNNSVDLENNQDKISQKSKNLDQQDKFFQGKCFSEEIDLNDQGKLKNTLFQMKSESISQQSDQVSQNNDSKSNILIEKKQSKLLFGRQTSSLSKSMRNQNIKSQFSENKNKMSSLQKVIEKQKKLKQKRQKKRTKIESEFAHIYRQSCYIDNQAITQRDRSELILYQDVFKLSTLDQFFRNSNLKIKNEMPSEAITPESSPLVETTGQQGVVAAGKKMSKFHTIKEEEEEENDNNNTLINLRQNHLLNLQVNQNISQKLIGAEEIQNIELDNIQQSELNQSKQVQTTADEKKSLANDKQIYITKKLSTMSSKQFNSFSELQNVIKEEEEVDEDNIRASHQEPSSQRNNGIASQGMLSERKGEPQGKRDLSSEIKCLQIQNTPIKNHNVINQIINHTKHQSLDRQRSGGTQQNRDSIESYKTLQMMKQQSQDSYHLKQESIYKSFSNYESLQSNSLNTSFQNQNNSIKRDQAAFKSQQNLNQFTQSNQFKQRYSEQMAKLQIQSRQSSFGGLIIVDASENPSKQNSNRLSSSSLSESSSLSSSPAIIKQLEKQESSKKNAARKSKNQTFEYLEQADSPQLRNKFPDRIYLPSKRTREENEILTENNLIQYTKNKDSSNVTQQRSQSEKKDSQQRRSLFSQVNEDQKKVSLLPTPSTTDLNQKDKQSQSYIQYSQSDDILPLQFQDSQSPNLQSPYEFNRGKMDLDKAENEHQFLGQINKRDTHPNKKLHLQVEDETQIERRKVSTIVEQSSNIEQDLFTDPFNHEDEVVQVKLSNNDNDPFGYYTNTRRSRSQTGGNIDGSDCAFISHAFEEQHNFILPQPQLLMGSGRNKDLNYNNFKKDIEAQLSPTIEGDNDLNQIDQNKDLEASFIEDLQNIQDKVFEEVEKDEVKKERKLKRQQKRQQQLERCRQELAQYYKSNLTDINAQLDSTQYQYMNFNPLISNQIGSKQKQQVVDNKAQRDIIQDRAKNHLMKNNLLNINQDLRNEQQVQMKIDLDNKNFIINKAILKSVDQNKIQKIELRHFRQLYGKQFEDMLDNDIFPLWHQQAKLLFHFDNILKYDFIPVEQFIQLYCSLEMQISSLLMNKFSCFKIIYQDQEDKWFTVNFVQEAFFLQEVERQGPWKNFDTLFENKDKQNIFKHRNIFSYNEKSEYIKKNLRKFFQISQDISNNFYFRKLQINQKRSDVVYIPFTNDNPEQTTKSLLDILKKTPTLPEYIKKDDMTLEMMPQIKKGLVIAYLFDNPNIKQRKRQFNSEKINIEQAIVEEDIIQKEQLNNTHNYSYSIELLKDMQKHIMMNKEMLFKKISQFYFYRSCFERNFCSIMEIPFEQ